MAHAPLRVARGQEALGPGGQLLDVPPVLFQRMLLPQMPLQHHNGALFVLGGSDFQGTCSQRCPRLGCGMGGAARLGGPSQESGARFLLATRSSATPRLPLDLL